MKIKVLAILLPITLVFSSSSFADSKEEKIEWSQVPPKVQQTITEHAQGGKILEIEKETEKQVIIYEAEVKKPDGKKFEIKVDENGKLIEIEDEDD